MMGLGASIGILDIGKEVPSYGNVMSATSMAREDRRLDGGNVVVIIIAALNVCWYGMIYLSVFLWNCELYKCPSSCKPEYSNSFL